jgi:UDP-N-acetylglucosamine 2-epimerase
MKIMRKRKIAVITGSRAEYGLLYWLMREIGEDSGLSLQVVVTGMHLEKAYGSTYRQIARDGFVIDAKVFMSLSCDSEVCITRAAGQGMAGFARAFNRLKPDMVVILGDRFEMLAAACSALLFRIPIIHISGGR